MSPLYPLLWGDTAKAMAVAAALNEAQWLALQRPAAQHRLRPLLHSRASAMGWPVPAAMHENWRMAHRRAALEALRQRAELERIGGILGAAGVRVAVLKGGAFVWNGWLDPALRPMRDLDLLVAPALAPRADALLRAAGFAGGAGEAGGKHLPPLISPIGVWVELHLHLYDTFDPAQAAAEAAFAARALGRAGPGVAPGVLALGTTDTLLHLILHAVRDHQFNNGPLLLTDLAVLTADGQIDWALFWTEAEALGAVRAAQLALRLGEELARARVDWQGHAAQQLPPRLLARAAALMLVDMDQRSALGWPGQLLRVPRGAWLAQLRAMVRRRQARAGEPGHGGWRIALGHMLGNHGRGRVADAVALGLWLRRG